MKLYTADELAEICKVSIGTIYRLGREKKLNVVYIGRSVRFTLPKVREVGNAYEEIERERTV